MNQSFTIPGRFVSLNQYIDAERSNRYTAARMKRDEQDKASWAIRAAGIKPMDGKVDIAITWSEANMKRDKDNIMFAKKFIFDALVECKVIPNDGWKYIGYISEQCVINKINPHVTVLLMEHNPKGRMLYYLPLNGE